jgi:hypothetical protein
MFDYFYGAQAEQFSFYRVPKVLFTRDQFKYLSAESKTLYGIMLDKLDLSVRNNWTDEQGRVYIIYTIEQIMRDLNCGNKKAGQLLQELEEKGGLIERKRQGLGRPISSLSKTSSAVWITPGRDISRSVRMTRQEVFFRHLRKCRNDTESILIITILILTIPILSYPDAMRKGCRSERSMRSTSGNR